MNNYEIDELQNQTDIDLKVIEKNPNYLIKKFNQLSRRGKQNLIDYLNISLKLAYKDTDKSCQQISNIPVKTIEDERIIPFPAISRGCNLD